MMKTQFLKRIAHPGASQVYPVCGMAAESWKGANG